MEEKEKGENIWRRKVFFAEMMTNGKGKGGKYLEKDNVLFAEKQRIKKKNKTIREGNYFCGGKG